MEDVELKTSHEKLNRFYAVFAIFVDRDRYREAGRGKLSTSAITGNTDKLNYTFTIFNPPYNQVQLGRNQTHLHQVHRLWFERNVL